MEQKQASPRFTPKLNDNSALSINLKWLVQIVILVGTTVYLYFGLISRISKNEAEVKRLNFNQTNYVFPDIRVIEEDIIKSRLDRTTLEKDILILKEKLKEIEDEIKWVESEIDLVKQ